MENTVETKISVAIATYNGAKYITHQIESLLNQTLRPHEIIVCDDRSNDGTIEILRRYEMQGKIKLSINEQPLGVIDNFKKAVSLCNFENFIALCDQDDIWEVDKLEIEVTELIKIHQKGVPVAVFSDLTLVDDKLNVIETSFIRTLNINPEKETLRTILYGNFITGCTMVFNPEMREYFLQIDSKYAHMHDAWIGLVSFTFGRWKYIPLQLVKYRQHGNNVTYATNKPQGFLVKIVNIFKEAFSKSQFLEKYITMSQGFLNAYRHKLSNDHVKEIEQFIALGHKPFFIKKINSIMARAYRYKL
jgi:glycosyltransferase involved in cell wall biosynthesis